MTGLIECNCFSSNFIYLYYFDTAALLEKFILLCIIFDAALVYVSAFDFLNVCVLYIILANVFFKTL